MKKKILAALLISTMALAGLTACGADSGDLATGGNGSTSAENSGGSSGSGSIDGQAAAADAKTAALADAGLTENQTIGIGVRQEFDDGMALVEVDIYTPDMDYSYSVKADDGTIVERESSAPPKMENINSSAPVTPAQAAEAALAQVSGATSDNIRMEFDHDDGMSIYEVEIIYNGMDYDMEINADTGDIIQSSQESLSMD